MIDSHFHPENWGIRPILFEIFGLKIPAYSFFVSLGFLVGVLVYFSLARKSDKNNENTSLIFASALIFGIIGAKLPILISNYRLILENPSNIALYLSGRTVVGGLIGGTIGVIIIKKVLNIKDRRGNLIAPAAAIGIGIGRIGCFFRGCCYGGPTALGIGVDFGDNIKRHPTQLYEVIFHFLMFLVLMILRKKVKTPGKLFKIYVSSYFIFRFLIEFLRVEPKVFLNLTGYQIASIFALLLINLKEIYYVKTTKVS